MADIPNGTVHTVTETLEGSFAYKFVGSPIHFHPLKPGVEPGFSAAQLTQVDVDADGLGLLVTFTLGVHGGQFLDVTTMDSPLEWTISALGESVQVVSVTDNGSTGTLHTLKLGLWPSLGPGQTYTITAPFAAHLNNELLVDNYQKFTASTSIETKLNTFPIGILRSLTLAFGEVCQKFSGRPSTRLAKDMAQGDTYLLVESTLGFPDSGDLFLQGREATYTSKTDGSFIGVTFNIPPRAGFPTGERVTLNARTIFPA